MKIGKLLLLILATGVASVQAQDISWPQRLEADNGAEIVIYQPQFEGFSGNSIEGRAAVSIKTRSSGGVPLFGAIWFKTKIDTDRDSRKAVIRDIDISDVRFADASDEDMQKLADFIEGQIEGSAYTISVDQILADLEADGVMDTNLQHEPPKIILSTQPAMLISIDGEPAIQQIEESKYERVVNSAFLIVKHGHDHYLYIGSNTWYKSRAIAGPWAKTKRVPENIAKLVQSTGEDDSDIGDVQIVIATEPTELIVSDGEPSWTPVEGMGLLYMDNTDSNAFLELSTQQYYVLLSGRWYRGMGMVDDIQWEHVPNDRLPEPFSDVREDSVNGAILSQVAGTPQARAAVLDNTIPQTAAINRDDTSLSIEYDGTPDFGPIEDIKVEYARNTSAAVFRYANLYYACDDGVWYVSNSATGPWGVATDIPDAIYKIPSSNPHHNVTYVRVYDVTPQVVYVGYTPGYYGSYYYRGSIVYGTGWYYNPWVGPRYYPRHPTWGLHVTYNPWYGWRFGVSWTHGPFRFTYSRHSGWWGVGGYRPYPRPVPYAGYRKTNINNISAGGGRPETRPNIYNRPANHMRNSKRPALPADRQARPADNVPNNALTDRSGNVYQRNENGNWRQRDNGQWTRPENLDRPSQPSARPSQPSVRPSQPSARPSQPSVRPSQPSVRPSQPSVRPSQPSVRPSQPSVRPSQQSVRPQLERDFNSRQQGAQRTRNYQNQASQQRRR